MREYSAPLRVALPTGGNLTDDVVRHATEHPDRVAFSRRVEDRWVGVTSAEFCERVRAVARGLVAAGVEPGARVGLISRTRYEWTVLDYAIWFAGAVTVPVYETSSAEQIRWILGDSGARAVIAETAEHLSRISRVRDDLDQLHQVWSIEENALDVLATLGQDVSCDELERRRTAAGPPDLATLVYTSGTTGRPRGCRLTHGNLMFELGVALDDLEPLFAPDDSATLLFLPLAHVFARIIQIGCVRAGTRMGHASDMHRLPDDLATFGPTFLLAVPRVFEKVFNTASQRAVADGRGAVFRRAVDVAIDWSRRQDAGHGTGPLPRRALRGRAGHRGPALRAQHALFERVVYARLREALGGRCEFAISGGAPLGERLGHFYRGIGITVLEGYGLTESAGALTVNLPDAQKIGTVGRPLQGTSVRVAEDGELLFRGGQVFAGYWGGERPAPTSAADPSAGPDPAGWLRTGDLGEIDEEGFVRITGRKKEILVTAGGKNVAPTVLEDRIRSHPLVDQCMVVGDGRPFVAALVTLDEEALSEWLRRHGKSGRPADHVGDPDLRAEVDRAVAHANEAVSQAESVRRFEILATTWTEEGGQLTPSLKLRRSVVMRECADQIEGLYTR